MTHKNLNLFRESPFGIKLNLDKDFVTEFKKLSKKYGDEIQKMNGFHNSQLNFTDFIDNFIDSETLADATIDGNANRNSKDIRALLSDMMKPHTKLLSFNKIFYEFKKKYGLKIARKWLEDEWSGALYMHNACTSSMQPYCFSYDLDEVVEKGLFFINRFKTSAAKRLTTFNDHVLEFISWASNRASGAVGLPSYLIYSYWYWKKDVENGYYMKSPEYYRDQCFQKLIFDLNQPFLRVVESAFTNISIFDREYLVSLFGGRQYPDGTYIVDYIEEIIEYQKSFMRMVSKIREDTFMTFPVLTYSLLYQDGKFVDEEFARWCNKHNMKWCDSNFFIGEDVSVLANCCRYLSDTTKVKKATGFINSIGGTSLKIGSVQVSTINLRRIALEANGNINTFFDILEERVDLDIQVLDVVRSIIKRNVEKNLLPNYSYGLIDMDTQYNTIGITALYEAVNEFGGISQDELGNKFYNEKGLKLAQDILTFIRNRKDSYDFDYSINIEAIPAESANVKLSYKDALLFPNSDEYFIYSNQWIPLMENCTLQEKIRLSAELDSVCEGGVISHINVAGDFTTEKQAWDLLNYIASQKVIYFAYNKAISVCKNEHGFFGDICPTCGEEKSDTYCRVVGFLTPRSSYSKERKREYDSRTWYSLSDY